MKKKEIVVIGGGPGGYTAAVRLAQEGGKVLLVEERERLGGVCLNEGCIPSKCLIQAAHAILAHKKWKAMGIEALPPTLHLDQVVAWKELVVKRLTGSIPHMMKANGVEVLHERVRFTGPGRLETDSGDGVPFSKALVATGSLPVALPFLKPDGESVVNAREALSFNRVPASLLIVGGGVIGLELGMVWAAMGSEVTVVEMLDHILPEMDEDVVRLVQRSVKKRGIKLLEKSRITSADVSKEGVKVAVTTPKGEMTLHSEKVLLSVGRRPNTRDLNLDSAGIETDEHGFIRVDETLKTTAEGIYAIGDCVGMPLLAHKAYRQAKVAAKVMMGEKTIYDNRVVPAVVYTDPEVASVGMSEREVKAENVKHEVHTFPLRASGRALTLNAPEGFIKVITGEGDKLLGVQMVGEGVSELLGEVTLAMEENLPLRRLARIIHAHPTLSEAVGEVVEIALGEGVHGG